MKKLLLLLSLLLSGNVFAGQNVTGDLYVSGNTGLGSTSPGAKLIVSSGNVGIGTPNPQKEFSLNGDIWIPNTSTGGTKGIIFKGSETFIHNFSPETTYSHNTFVGLNSGNFTMTGGAAFGNSSMNTGLGWMSLNSITTGRANLGLGSGGLRYVTSGDYNIGLNGGIGITTQSNNIMIGAFAGYFTVGGDNNVVVGNNTVPMSGSDNTVIGNMSFGSSLTDTTIGNTSLGSNSGLTIDNGNYNSFIGYNAGNYINAGDNNVCLGRDSCKYEDTGQTLNNSIAIGYNSRVNDTNAAAIGGTGADAVNVGIGTSIPNATLEVIKNGTKPYFMLSSAAITHGDIITVNSAGNTGIGNSSPTQKLDVTGIIRASSDIKVGSNSVCQSDGTNCAPVASGWSYVSPNIYPATLTDNVGVGTLSPDAELSITSTAANNLFRVNDNGPGDTSPFVINSSGNVGIYTAFPQRMLDIYQESGGSLLPTIYMHSDSTTGSPMVQFINSSASELFIRQLAPSSSGSFGSGNSEIISNTVTGNFVIGTIAATDLRLATNTSERMRISSSGNVGIGTINPGKTLDITGTFRVSDKAYFTGSELYPASSAVAFGDSYTSGSGASSTANSYIGLLRTSLNWSITNKAVGGSQCASQAQYVYAETPSYTSNYIYWIGYNDSGAYSGASYGPSLYQSCLISQIGYLGSAGYQKFTASSASVTKTGSWSTSSYYSIGQSSHTNGDTISTTVTGKNIIIGYTAVDSDGGTFTVTIDGVQYGGTYTTAPIGAIIPTLGETNVPQSIVIPTPFNSTHTVLITVTSSTSASNNVNIDWIGGFGNNSNTTGPNVYTLNLNYSPSKASVGPTMPLFTRYQNSLSNAVNLLSKLGVNVVIGDIASKMLQASDYDADNIHPNDTGHSKIAETFKQIINSLSTTIAKQRGSDPIPSIDWDPTATTFYYNDSSNNRTQTMNIVSQNVGIGTESNPQALLEIRSALAQNLFKVSDVSGSSDADPFIIDSTGNVGIGTIITSGGLVTIDGGTGGTAIFTVKRGAGHGGANGAVSLNIGSAIPQIGFDDNGGGSTLDWSMGYNSALTRFSINKASSVGSGGEKLVIDNNGNIGIGTFSPFGGGVIITNGNVGINSLTPGYLLDVNGAMRLTGTGASGSKHQDAANQACTTTCTTGRAMIGIDTATGKFVDPTDATADSCMCGG